MSSHIFFCNQTDCSNMTTSYDSACPDCGDTGATVLGSNYCHECDSHRNHPCNGWCPDCNLVAVVPPNLCADCQYKRDDVCMCDGGDEPCDHCARYLADQAEYEIWCGVPEPPCTCDGSGRMCDHCADEYAEPCRGCGVSSQLWTDNTYCRKCFVERYGDEFPKTRPPLPPSPPPRHTSLQSMRDEIEEIEVRLRGGLTKGQRDDWIWLLQNRRADLAEAEKEMWAGYDADDLRKLDMHMRY
jgi:hypothetical protein